jgi:2-phospho-L-lactate guanylyltransferase
MAQALVPLKDLVDAKTRLSGLLRPAQRRALAQAMVEDVLTTLTAHPGINRVTLVSDDPGADLLACKYEIDFLDEHSLGVRGLNPVIAGACEALQIRAEEPLIVLHGDIPMLSKADISAVLNAQAELRGLIIGCDQLAEGTNLLAFDKNSRPKFAFGTDSCASHSRNAEQAGIPFKVLHRQGIGLDVDEPRDLAVLMRQLTGKPRGHTAKLLLQTELGNQVERLLHSLECGDQSPVNHGTAK